MRRRYWQNFCDYHFSVRIIYLTESRESPALLADDVPQPQPGRGEVLVRVNAAGLTPTELLWYPTSHNKTGVKRSRPVPGHEFSGVIAALGEDAAGVEAGQEVYGMNDWFSEGALAEYCITQPSSIAPKPSRLTHAEAASVPIGALTAWQGLYDRAQLRAGESVLIHGGAGSVGVFAVQLARRRGANVIATASSRNLDFVSTLGADRVIDYRAGRFEETAPKVDVVFDTVGGDVLRRSWALLRPGGRMITIAATGEAAVDEKVKQAFFIVEPNRDQLVEIGGLLDSGELQPVVDAVLPLSEAPAAFAGKVGPRQGRGKLVVEPIPFCSN